jgi:hypothetical protein
MRYFPHPTDMGDNAELSLLLYRFGYEGIGLYYTILERLLKNENPIKTEVLKSQLKVGKRLEKCWAFMEEIGIISTKNGETFSKLSENFLETFRNNREKNRNKVSEWRIRQGSDKNVTSYKAVTNQNVTPLELKVKVKLKEEEENKQKKLPEVASQHSDALPLADHFLSTLPELIAVKISLADKVKWADIIDKLIRIDGYQPEDIKTVINYFRADEFWSKNFLSPAKLRTKTKDGIIYMDYFANKIKIERNANGRITKSPEQLAEYARKLGERLQAKYGR